MFSLSEREGAEARIRRTMLRKKMPVLVLPLLLFGFVLYTTFAANYRATSTPVPVPMKSNCCFDNKFKDTVLIVVYNYALYSNLPLLRSLYGCAFPTIMFCGPSASDKYPVEAVITEKGYFFYTCMEHAMKLHPDFAGYLLIADDMVLNYWQLVEYDPNKLWEGPRVPINVIPGEWHWWHGRYGRKQCQLARNETKHDQPGLDVHKYADILAANGNGIERCYRGRSDIFYVPQKFASAYQMLSVVFAKNEVFVEITVPTIFRMLDNAQNIEQINGIYITYPDVNYFWKLYKESLTFMHPLKLSSDSSSTKFNLAQLEDRVLKYSRNLTQC